MKPAKDINMATQSEIGAFADEKQVPDMFIYVCILCMVDYVIFVCFVYYYLNIDILCIDVCTYVCIQSEIGAFADKKQLYNVIM